MSSPTAPTGSCSRSSLEHGEQLEGTAATATGYFLLEHGGPWDSITMASEFRDADGTPVDVGQKLHEVLDPLGVRPLLIRRPRSAHGIPASATVMLIALTATHGVGARTTVPSLSDIAAWDLPSLLAQLRTGHISTGWQLLDTQFLVCTHARRDVCCAVLGRPVMATLATLAPEQTWEVSHLGGHRLAATTLVVPDGLVYGRLRPQDATLVRDAHTRGRLHVAALRGRASLSPPVQVAEIAVRRAAGHDKGTGVQLLDAAQDHARTVTLWAVEDNLWRAVVDSRPGTGPARPASCTAAAGPSPPQHVVVEIMEVRGH